MELTVISLIVVFSSMTLGQPAYESDCEQTFHQANSSIFVPQFSGPTSCYWRFKTHVGDTFKLTFNDFGVDGEQADCSQHYVAVQDGNEELKHCGKYTPYDITTKGSTITIRYWENKQMNFFLDAFISSDTKSEYTLNDSSVTWLDAVETCKQNGGILARSFPVVPDKLKTLIDNTDHLNKAYWIGKSLSPWVILRGCVRLVKHEDHTKVYTESKYNQMSECASACYGSSSFLLQGKFCYCLNKEEKKDVTYVPYRKCNTVCPGMSLEKCGGSNVFTLYEYYDVETDIDNEMHNCVSLRHESYVQSDCDVDRGFTCQLENGSKVTFSKDIPRRNQSLSLYNAIEFCAQLTDGLRIAPLPIFPEPYFGEEYWTTIMRAIDWNYDSISRRRPDFSSVSTLSDRGFYVEMFRNSSEKHGFVCQHDFVTCGHKAESDNGSITSPSYPLEYGHGFVCEWHITVNESKIIQLQIVDLDIEDSAGCIYDYLMVVQNNTTVERLCGRLSQKFIYTQYHEVTLLFRSDDTVSGTGFRSSWSAVDENLISDDSSNAGKTSEPKSISGGVVVGITVAVAVFCIIVISLLACVCYRKRHPPHSIQDYDETSTAHNLVYAISSFSADSSFNNDDDNKSYQNSSQTRRKQNLKAEASYANDPSKDKKSCENEYLEINYQRKDYIGGLNAESGSKDNLLLDSDSNASDITGGRNTRVEPNDEYVGREFGESTARGINMSNINDLGKECIKVDRIEEISDQGLTSTAAYADIRPEKTTHSRKVNGEDAYLNAGLSSDVKMPHYEDIDSSEGTQYYTKEDKNQNAKGAKAEKGDSYIYL